MDTASFSFISILPGAFPGGERSIHGPPMAEASLDLSRLSTRGEFCWPVVGPWSGKMNRHEHKRCCRAEEACGEQGESWRQATKAGHWAPASQKIVRQCQ